ACRHVWAAGPRDVVLTSSREILDRTQAGARHFSPANGTNGNGHSNGNGSSANANSAGNGQARRSPDRGSGHPPAAPAPAGTPPPVPPGASSPAQGVVLDTVVAEMRILQRQVEHLRTALQAHNRDDETLRATELILSEFHALPTRIAGAIGAALQEQHRAIVN